MALSVVSTDSVPKRAPIDWAAVQFAQFEHDEKYHREISRLPMQSRLRHMALHFAKYAGRLHEGLNDATFKRTAIDALIIAISCANILNIDLSARELDGGQLSRADFARGLTVAAGRMAAACERLDHLEDFPFRTAIAGEVIAVLQACLCLFAAEGWGATKEMEERLANIKAKQIFHGKL